MNYQTFQPSPSLQSLVSCYWTLEVPVNPDVRKQRIIPDGCIEMAFILGDDIRRYTSHNDFIIQPRAMVLGQTIDPFYIEPTGYVNTFAIRFYPYGFSNFVNVPIKTLANTETPIEELFEKSIAQDLTQKVNQAVSTEQRIAVIEAFLLSILSEQSMVDKIVKSTVDILFASKGSAAIGNIANMDHAKRRQLERKFAQQIGISPKQLGKVIRLQSALKRMLDGEIENLTQVAYDSDFYDQAHFIKDFKEFTGTNPKDFFTNESMILSSLFYKTES